jgi:hypothetical protein
MQSQLKNLSKIWGKAYNQVWHQVWHQVYGQVQKQVFCESHDIYRFAFYAYMMQVLRAETPEALITLILLIQEIN